MTSIAPVFTPRFAKVRTPALTHLSAIACVPRSRVVVMVRPPSYSACSPYLFLTYWTT